MMSAFAHMLYGCPGRIGIGKSAYVFLRFRTALALRFNSLQMSRMIMTESGLLLMVFTSFSLVCKIYPKLYPKCLQIRIHTNKKNPELTGLLIEYSDQKFLVWNKINKLGYSSVSQIFVPLFSPSKMNLLCPASHLLKTGNDTPHIAASSLRLSNGPPLRKSVA